MQEDLERLLKLMKTIKYGWVGYDGEKHEKIGKKFAEEYRLQLKSDLLSTKLGVCWDQVEYEAWVLGDTCEFKRIAFVYYGEKEMPSHTFIVVHENNDWFWLEHAWGRKAGVYKFGSLEELLKAAMKDWIKDFPLPDDYDKDRIAIYDYPEPLMNLSSDEFYRHLETGKKISTKGIVD